MAVLNIQVAANNDDCRVTYTAVIWTIALNGPPNVGYAAATAYKRGAGLRFLNVTIPADSTITTAYLTLTAIENRSLTTVNSRIIGDLETNAATFSTIADYQARRGTDVGGANNNLRTTAQVAWDNIGTWTLDTEYQSPEIKTVIQEIIDQAGWASGNALALFWDDHEGRTTATDGTYRNCYDYEQGSGTSVQPKLHIEYTVPGLTKTLTEEFTLSDIKSNGTSKTTAESVTTSDVHSRSWGMSRAYSDSITPTASYNRVWNMVSRVSPENIVTSDSIEKNANKLLFDALNISELLQRVYAIIKLDSISVSDIRILILNRDFAEILIVSDELNRNRFKYLLENIALSELVTKVPEVTTWGGVTTGSGLWTLVSSPSNIWIQ